MLKNSLTEKTVLFISILKWFVLATGVGVATGLSVSAFLRLLKWSDGVASGYRYYYFALPFVLALNALLANYVLKDAAGEGTEKIIEAVHKTSGKLKWHLIPVKLLATILTIASGGSVGKEGPCAEAGGGISSALADLFRFDDDDRKKLVICGISAGFASVFGTPIGGAIFGVEVLFIGSLLYDVLLPSFISGIVSYQVSSSLGIQYFYHPLNFIPFFSELFFIKVVIAGMFFGVCSIGLIETVRFFDRIAKKIKLADLAKNFAAGVSLIVLSLLFSDRFLGLGLNHIESTLEGGKAAWWVFPMKMVFTGITLAFGGSGGIVTPIFFIGSSAGAFLARWLNIDIATFAAIGMVSVLAGCANTPIAASIMAIELFGAKVAPYAAVSSVVAFLMTGHTSVLSSQVLAISKSPSLDVELGKEIEELEKLEAHLQVRKHSVLGLLFQKVVPLFQNLLKSRRKAGTKDEEETKDDVNKL